MKHLVEEIRCDMGVIRCSALSLNHFTSRACMEDVEITVREAPPARHRANLTFASLLFGAIVLLVTEILPAFFDGRVANAIGVQ
jgi:hypothetical protein